MGLMLAALTALATWFGFAYDARLSDRHRADTARAAESVLRASLGETVARSSSLAGLYESSDRVTDAELDHFVNRLLATVGASGFGWLESLQDRDRAQFERELGRPVVELGPRNALTPAARRPTYAVMRQLVTRQPSRSVIGLDSSADPVRRKVLSAAVRARAPRSTPVTVLAGSLAPGVIVYSPVFMPGQPSRLRGFAFGSYQIDRLELDLSTAVPGGGALRLSQGDRVLVRHGELDGSERHHIVIAGQSWTLEVSAPSASVVGAGVGSLLLTLSLSLVVLVLFREATRRTHERDAAEQGRRLSEARFEDSFDGAPIGMALVSPDGRFQRVNPALCALLRRTAGELLEETTDSLSHPDDVLSTMARRARLLEPGGAPERTEKRWLRPDGSTVLAKMSITANFDETGQPTGAFAQFEDITAERDAQRALRMSELRHRAAFEHAPVGMAVLGLDARILSVNAALCAMTGHPSARLTGSTARTLLHSEDVEEGETKLLALIRDGEAATSMDARLIDAAGQAVDVSLHATCVYADDGAPDHMILQVLDVTERKRSEAQLQFFADHDPLTGMLNRRRMAQELERHVAHITRYGPDGAVIVVDIDHFKRVNDTLGHAVGDQLIQSVADALRGRLRETDMLARLGGDEFCILLSKTDRAGAQHVAASLVANVRQHTAIVGEKRAVTISVGVTMCEPRDGLTGEDLIIDADFAMYDAKHAGRDGYALFAAVPRPSLI